LLRLGKVTFKLEKLQQEENMGKRTVFQLIVGIVGLAMVAGLSGCGQKTTYGAVKFVTNPKGAEVVNLRDDATLGMSPTVVTWESQDGKPEYVTVEMRKTGYKEEITSLWVNMRHESREEAQKEAQEINLDLEKR